LTRLDLHLHRNEISDVAVLEGRDEANLMPVASSVIDKRPAVILAFAIVTTCGMARLTELDVMSHSMEPKQAEPHAVS
jgi:hypothetical protein